MKTAATAEAWTVPRGLRDPLIGGAGLLLILVGAAFSRRSGAPAGPISPWLAIHLATIIPAVPLGAIVLFRRKGGRTHRRLGYVWVTLMMVGATVSFGVKELLGTLSPIHLFRC